MLTFQGLLCLRHHGKEAGAITDGHTRRRSSLTVLTPYLQMCFFSTFHQCPLNPYILGNIFFCNVLVVSILTASMGGDYSHMDLEYTVMIFIRHVEQYI
jgi:hypothetical protein